jgi:2-polyprenyl-3-methyl-5-hydroxy-6-metoxy-1,4-benzoquinol methylase
MERATFDEVYDRYIRGGRFFEEREYYQQFRGRYSSTFRWIEPVLPRGGRMLDVGSGQFAVLCRHLLQASCDVVDIDTRSADALKENGVGFFPADLTVEAISGQGPYDLVVMAEVIEHIPTPPYIVFANLRPVIRPGGHLLVTTPNVYRLRNLFRMALGKKIFDNFVVPGPDQPLGHFLEYAREQMEWHLEKAGYKIVKSSLEQLSWGGASPFARVSRLVSAPLVHVRPLWRDSMVILATRS